MSAQAALAKLAPPLRDLVSAAAPDGTESFVGKSDKDKAEVAQWIAKVAQGDVTKTENLKVNDTEQDLEASLVPRSYLVANYFTAADVALYGALHPILSQLQPAQYYSHPAITRYFDHVQSRPSVRRAAEPLAPAFSVVSFNFENAPPQERKADPPKEKKSKSSTPAPDGDKAAVKADKVSAKADKAAMSGEEGKKAAESGEKEGKAQKKEKKAKEPKEPKAAEKKPAAEDAGPPLPSMIDLRVGHIVDINKHPDADGLYVEQIDFGEPEGPRTVVSGLVNYIPIDQMRDKYLVGVCNLKPANMRGVKSFAMVLCATHKDGKDAGIELVQPPAGSKVGERIFFEGFEEKDPLSQLNPKKKIFETIQPGFTTLDSREAAWVNPETKSVHKIRTKEGICVAPHFVGASLS
ncbi:hypothetical protein GSI_15249 [Ganoderma sinense ZZ0214-1]|uniref:tRNA-binding domain-containing protein n=1 Tax=Ganoderma sinense ZZ0214-1 TaxID=1077348 RepID=A0A2G8RM31_9APHY|nr:hypothetical protein GSI_15249 [Ganoderma sinense ZZ0214-1]